MKRYLDPEILGLRLSAKVKGLRYQVIIAVEGKRDCLILDGMMPGVVMAQRERATTRGYLVWEQSAFGKLPPEEALAKFALRARSIVVKIFAGGTWSVAHECATWKALEEWLATAKETAPQTTVNVPLSLYRAAQKFAEAQRKDGGEGTFKSVVVAALEEYLERHG